MSAFRILLIEDDDADARQLKRLLTGSAGRDHTIEHVNGLQPALLALVRKPPDLILISLHLSEGSGLDGVRTIAQRAPEIPLVTLASSESDGLALQSLKEGSQDYLVKADLDGLLLARSIQHAIERKAAQRVLWESSAMYRTLVEQLPGVVYRRTIDGGAVTYVSPQLEPMLGFQPEAWLNNSNLITNRIHPDDRLHTFERLARSGATGEPFRAEYRVQREDGAWIWVSDEALVVRGDGQALPRFQGVMFDITERMHAKQEVSGRDKWFAALIENALDAIAVVALDGEVLFVSPSVERILGYRPDDVTGRALLELVHPEDSTEAIQHLAKAAADPESVQEMVVRLQHQDGSWRVHEATGRMLPVDAPMAGIVINTRDVTDRNRTHRERARLTAAIDQGSDATIMTDPDGTIRYVNPAFERITGYSAREVLDENPSTLKGGRHEQPFYEQLWKAMKSGESWSGRLENRRKDGTKYLQQTTIFPVTDDSGTVVSLVGIGRDVTRELELEDQLRQSQKMEAVGRLAGGVAHDFNNLLTVILSESDLALTSLGGDDDLRAPLEDIRSAADRASRLTRQLLSFSRRQIVQATVFGINDVIRDMERLLRRLIGEDVDLSAELAPDAGAVNADRGQIEQVIVNLVVNARDAMQDGGKILIRTENQRLDAAYSESHADVEPGDYVMFSVSDTGIGMSRELRGRIFEPFFTTKEAGRGTGLGLATCYGIVRECGGHIGVYSEVGLGTTLKVYLPRERSAVPRVSAGVGPAGEGTETILVVEDEDAVRRIAVRVLERFGYKTLAAPDAKTAFAYLDAPTENIDLLLSDLVLPEMNGREVAEHARAVRPDLPVLFMSGYTEDVVLHQQMVDLGSDLVQKPFTIESLVSSVRRVLDCPAGRSTPSAGSSSPVA